MSGRLIAVVGASGVGKDSLIAALGAAQPGLHVVRRVVTRPAAPDTEPFEPVSEAGFAARAASGAFCLHWRAHGLGYGIPRDALKGTLAGGDVVANLSRGVLTRAAGVFPAMKVLHVTATPDAVAARLSARGREDADEIAARLARADLALPEGLDIATIRNDGSLEAARDQALAALAPVRA